MKIYALTVAAIGALALAGCQTTGGPTADPSAVIADALAYVCPIASGVQVSTLRLTTADAAIVNTAVADCQMWEANPSSSFTSPAVVASVLVQAAVIIQQSGAFKALPHEKQVGFTRSVAHLKTLPVR